MLFCRRALRFRRFQKRRSRLHRETTSDALHNGAGRLLRLNPPLKLLEKIAMAFDFNENALSRIRYVAVEFQFCRQAVNKRAKADSLNGTAHDDFQSFAFGRDGLDVRCGALGERALPACCGGPTIVSIWPNQKVCSRIRFDRREKVQS